MRPPPLSAAGVSKTRIQRIERIFLRLVSQVKSDRLPEFPIMLVFVIVIGVTWIEPK